MPIRDTSGRAQRSGYTFANQGASAAASNVGVGKFVLRRLPGLDFWSPSWGEETVIRIFPATSPEDRTQFDPFRLSTNYCDFGDWIRVYEAVRNFGNPGVTMLLHNGLNPSYDAQLMNPCWVLYRAINQALSQGQGPAEWVPITKGGQGKSAQLSKPSKLYLVQCAVFRQKSKDTFSGGKVPLGASIDGPTIVMGLPPTAGEGLVFLLEQKDEDWKGSHTDMAQYKYGDVVGINEGQFVHIYELGKDPRARARQAASPTSIYTSSQPSSGGRGMEAKGYGVFLTKTLDGNPNDPSAALTGMEDMVRTRFKPWEDILEFKSDEEQAHLIAPLFPASAITYAWRDRPAWIPDSVKETDNYNTRKPVSAPVINTWGKAAPAVVPPVWSSDATNTLADAVAEDAVAESVGDDITTRLTAARSKLVTAQQFNA